MRRLFLLLFAAAVSFPAIAQQERSEIRAGNKQYQRENYVEAGAHYQSALEKNPQSFEAAFNLAGALYKQGNHEDSEAIMTRLAPAAGDSHRADTWFNLGNAQFQQRKQQEAIESYKNALRINPNDMDAKFNLAYAKKLLEDDENQDQNQDGDGDGGGGGSNDPDDPNQNPDNQSGDDPQNDPNDPDAGNQQQDPGDPSQPQQEPTMSKEEAQQLLNALQNSEENTQKKVNDQKAQEVGVKSKKNW